MDSQHVPPLVAVIGMVSTFTLQDVNAMMGIVVGAFTVTYLIIKIVKEIKHGK
jgi:hypothetical protein|tara:strand:- start:407 stop:565 length:159 start_codon:yes stop_codon:yes gene_type:complete